MERLEAHADLLRNMESINKQRQNEHEDVAKSKIAKLEEIITQNKEAKLQAPKFQPKEIKAFCEKYIDKLYFAPFLRGLRRFVQIQIGRSEIVEWRVLDDVFTQSEDIYMVELLQLLSKIGMDATKFSDLERDWHIEADDKSLEAIVNVLKKQEKKLKHVTKPTGQLIFTDKKR